MPRFVLIPGADGRAWYWHRLAPLLEQRGHRAVAVNLPVGDADAGFAQYVEAVMRTTGDQRRVVLVAQSLGGFIAPLVAERVPVTEIVLVNAMVPKPGESPGEWWDATGQEAARAGYYAQQGWELPAQFDVWEAFFHDVPEEVVEAAKKGGEPVSRFDTLFSQPWPLDRWPDVRTRFLQGRDDRFFPLEFQRRVVKERLGIEVEDLPGGHLIALSHPVELADALASLS